MYILNVNRFLYIFVTIYKQGCWRADEYGNMSNEPEADQNSQPPVSQNSLYGRYCIGAVGYCCYHLAKLLGADISGGVDAGD